MSRLAVDILSKTCCLISKLETTRVFSILMINLCVVIKMSKIKLTLSVHKEVSDEGKKEYTGK